MRLEAKHKELRQECTREVVETSNKVVEHIEGKMGIVKKEQDGKMRKDAGASTGIKKNRRCGR